MKIESITSLQNAKIKFLVKLRKRKVRDEKRLMLVEGFRESFRANEQGIIFEEFYFCRDFFLGENEDTLLENIFNSGAKLFEIPSSVFEKISYRDRPDGLLGVAPYFDTSLNLLSLSENPFIVIAEAIEKPGNLGTILRTIDAAGADAIILCDQCTDIFNPNVVRASTGALFSVPVYESTAEELVLFMQKNKIQTVGAEPKVDFPFTQVDFRKPTAIVLGTEQYGLSDVWTKEASCLVKIPMKGMADSLNVAQAGTIMMYEVLRQREGES